MRRTFFALLSLADLNAKKSTPKHQSEENQETPTHAETPINTPVIGHGGPSLHYNIQVHLPATKDIEVYNAIFKSLKEHLF